MGSQRKQVDLPISGAAPVDARTAAIMEVNLFAVPMPELGFSTPSLDQHEAQLRCPRCGEFDTAAHSCTHGTDTPALDVCAPAIVEKAGRARGRVSSACQVEGHVCNIAHRRHH
uniref:Uncharacterized protein n=1 Tax=Diacronema lutheri TaxID=2081491 RepID=A0A7R9UIM7_DIALT